MLQGRGRSESASSTLAGVMGAVCLLLAGCGGPDRHAGLNETAAPEEMDEPVQKSPGSYRVGRPYFVGGRPYFPSDNPNYRAEGIASWYGPDFHNRRTANGETFDMHGISAAHPTMPLPSYARVSNLANGRSVIVRVNDRGPFKGNRVIDVSGKAAELLGFRQNGLAQVRVEYVARAPLTGSDDRMLMATLRQGEPAPAPSQVMVASARPIVPEVRSPVQVAEVPAQSGSMRPAPAGSRRESSRREAVALTAPPRASAGRGATRQPSVAYADNEEPREEAPEETISFARGRGLY